jgi:hypothetical protein
MESKIKYVKLQYLALQGLKSLNQETGLDIFIVLYRFTILI